MCYIDKKILLKNDHNLVQYDYSVLHNNEFPENEFPEIILFEKEEKSFSHVLIVFTSLIIFYYLLYKIYTYIF